MIPYFADHAANERTYLAWVRTAITVMAFGFLLERFDIFLFYAARATAQPTPAPHLRGSEWLGLGLLLFGALLILVASLRYRRNRTLIEQAEVGHYGNTLLEHLMAPLLIVMALFLIVYVGRQILALG